LPSVDLEHEIGVGSARLGSFVWPGMVLVGLALAAAVYSAWPEATTRTVRLPYGEAQPKAPRMTEERTGARVAAVRPKPAPPAVAAAQPEPERVLAGVEPAPVPAREQSSPAEAVDPADGPAPVPSETELADDYVQEPPEQLGAEPLPGVEPTPAPPVAAG
jgi:hypothetical protein